MASNKQQQPAQGVIVKHDHGCLVSLLVMVLFGWIGVAWLACVWTVKTAWRVTRWVAVTSWRWLVAYPVKYTALACVRAWRGALALVQRIQARQG